MTDTPIPVESSPSERLTAAIEQFGEAGVVERSIALLGGFNVGDEFLLYLGGVHAQGIVDGAPALYWPEVWGARALLTVWDDSASDAVAAALTNQAWRVREMAARVVGARSLALAGTLRAMLTDEVARVRAASARALGEVGEASDVELVANLFRDAEIDVRRAAQAATVRLKARTAS
jgi:hypothetical protein